MIYTVRPCLIHTCHAAPMPCCNHAVLLNVTAQHGRRETAVLCCGLEKNGMVRAWHGHGMASVNQTRPHCVNQMVAVSRRPCCAVALRRTAWSEHGMANVNKTRPHCVNQMGKTHSKPLAARHGKGTAWRWNGMGAACYV
jgi:hypothetical protein